MHNIRYCYQMSINTGYKIIEDGNYENKFCHRHYVLYHCLPETCTDANQADIIFLLDGSGSVTYDGFAKALYYVTRLVDVFSIGPEATQVALVIFSSNIRIHFNLNTYSTSTKLKEAILNTQ
jgi:hypothetical protein